MVRRAARSYPVRGIAVRMLEEIEKKPHPQRQMAPLRKHGMNADGGRRIAVEHAHETPGRDVRADLPP